MTFLLILVIILLCLIFSRLGGILMQLSDSRDEVEEKMNYPVFPPEQIRETLQDIEKYHDKFQTLEAQRIELSEKEKDTKKTKNLSIEIKSVSEKALRAHVSMGVYQKRLNAMTEGNIAVLSGKRRIKQVEDEFYDKWDYFLIRKLIDKRMKAIKKGK